MPPAVIGCSRASMKKLVKIRRPPKQLAPATAIVTLATNSGTNAPIVCPDGAAMCGSAIHQRSTSEAMNGTTIAGKVEPIMDLPVKLGMLERYILAAVVLEQSGSSYGGENKHCSLCLA